jgi:hypothetical protein
MLSNLRIMSRRANCTLPQCLVLAAVSDAQAVAASVLRCPQQLGAVAT